MRLKTFFKISLYALRLKTFLKISLYALTRSKETEIEGLSFLQTVELAEMIQGIAENYFEKRGISLLKKEKDAVVCDLTPKAVRKIESYMKGRSIYFNDKELVEGIYEELKEVVDNEFLKRKKNFNIIKGKFI